MTPADLSQLIKDTATAVMTERDLDSSVLPEVVTVERPRNPEHGDYASNVALQVAKKAGANPREFASWLAEALGENAAIDHAEIAGPGFLNIRLAADAQGEIVAKSLREKMFSEIRICVLDSASTSNLFRQTLQGLSTLVVHVGLPSAIP